MWFDYLTRLRDDQTWVSVENDKSVWGEGLISEVYDDYIVFSFNWDTDQGQCLCQSAIPIDKLSAVTVITPMSAK
jgi:hypothetical protein